MKLKKIMSFLKRTHYQKKLVFIRYTYSLLKKRGFGNLGKHSFIWKPIFLSGTKYYFIGNNVEIWHNARIEAIDNWEKVKYSPRLLIGDNVHIGQDCHITVAQSIEIEEDVVCAPRVMITDISHDFDDLSKPVLNQGLSAKPVKICKGAFIGANSVILPGITIGKHAVIGANSVVSHNVPDYAIAVGVPSRIIRERG